MSEILPSRQWIPRDITQGYGLPCYIEETNKVLHGMVVYLSGFVATRDDGRAVVDMFSGLARMDDRYSQFISVKIGVRREHVRFLELLKERLSASQFVLSRELIKRAYDDYMDGPLLPTSLHNASCLTGRYEGKLALV